MRKNLKFFTKSVKALEKNWIKICEFSDNDYDIHYFSSRAIIDDNVLDKLKENKTIDEIKDYLINLKNECNNDFDEFFIENNYKSEKRRGNLDEINFLLRIFYQEYN